MSSLAEKYEAERIEGEKQINITLRKWQIRYLLGAIRLGIYAELWGNALYGAAVCGGDTRSARWRTSVNDIIATINSQTNITEEYKADGCSAAVKIIDDLVDKECLEMEKAYERYQDESNKICELERSKLHNKIKRYIDDIKRKLYNGSK